MVPAYFVNMAYALVIRKCIVNYLQFLRDIDKLQFAYLIFAQRYTFTNIKLEHVQNSIYFIQKVTYVIHLHVPSAKFAH